MYLNFVGKDPKKLVETANSNPTTEVSPKTDNRKILWLIVPVLLVVVLVVNVMSNNEPKPTVAPADEQALYALTEKITNNIALTDNEWSELCRLLAIVKGINIRACDSCHNYMRALLGGKHSGDYKRYKNVSDKELNKGINSYEKQIQKHFDKIKNPQKYIPDWDNLDIREREALVNKKWKEDIERQTEQKEILQCILKNR